MGGIRRPAVAGTWYPKNATALTRAVDSCFRDVTADGEVIAPLAIVAPHAALKYSGAVAAHAYGAVAGRAYSAAVVVGPSHFVGFDGTSIWATGAWDTPLGAVMVDEPLATALIDACAGARDEGSPHLREHSIEMQLPFIATRLPGMPIVPVVMGYQTRRTCERLGDALARVVSPERGGHRALLVASTDLSHYRDAREAVRMDATVLECVAALDAEGLMRALEHEPGHACGGGPLVAVLKAASRLGARSGHVLRYADSGDVSGDKSAVVGYMAAVIR